MRNAENIEHANKTNAKHPDESQAPLLFKPQWWMSATQNESGRKNPNLKLRTCSKLEVKFQNQIVSCAAVDPAPRP